MTHAEHIHDKWQMLCPTPIYHTLRMIKIDSNTIRILLCYPNPDLKPSYSVSNHQPHHWLLNRLFRSKSKKTSKLRVTGLCAGNSPGTGEFPAQIASNEENVSIWWRHNAYFHIPHQKQFLKRRILFTNSAKYINTSNTNSYKNGPEFCPKMFSRKDTVSENERRWCEALWNIDW